MKVLSIDLDYFMGPTIELYNSLFYEQNPLSRWEELYSNTDFKESHFYIDQGCLLYCYNLFLKALKNNPTVVFGYDHDTILYDIHECDKIDLINIDHHDDIISGDMRDLNKEYNYLINHDRIYEGNWIGWLHGKNKLNSLVWIHNPTSANLRRNEFNVQMLGDKYQWHLRDQYKFENYDFDHVFVCASPQYIPHCHWHYFTMFMMAYEEFTGKEVKYIACRERVEFQKLNFLKYNS